MPQISNNANSSTLLGYQICAEHGSSDEKDRSFHIYAYYQTTGNRTANIYIKVLFSSSGRISGTAKLNCTGLGSPSFSFSQNSWYTSGPIAVTYGSDGTLNKALTISISNVSASWVGNGSFDGSITNGAINTTVTLPALPTGSVSSALYQNGFHNYVVAGHSKIQETISYNNTKKIVVNYKKDGVTSGTYTIKNDSTASSGTATHSVFVPPGSSSDYNLTVEVILTNDNGSTTISTTQLVKGYSLPTYNSATYTVRCRQDGTADSQGEYGKLHLAWSNSGSNPSITPVDTSNRNSLQTLLVKVSRNGVEETLFNGSAPSAGSLDLIFPLAVNVQGNLIVKFTDQIDNNTVTSLVVPKSTMPLAMYQDGDDVGVSIGRMATEAGFWVYEQMYLKDPNSTTIYRIYIEGGVVKAAAI